MNWAGKIFLILVLFTVAALPVHTQPLGLGAKTATTLAPTKTPEQVINDERTMVIERLKVIDQEIPESSGAESERLKSLRSSYSELLGILDIQLIALADSKRLAENAKRPEQIFDALVTEIRSKVEKDSLSELLELESAYIDVNDEHNNTQKTISHYHQEVRNQQNDAANIAKQIRLEKDQTARRDQTGFDPEPLTVKQKIAEATAALRKIEIEGLNYRRDQAALFAEKLLGEIRELKKRFKPSEAQLKKISDTLDQEVASVISEISQRQKELNQELVKSPGIGDEAEKRLLRLYSDLLVIYLTSLRSEQEFIEVRKKLLSKRIAFHQGKLSTDEARQVQIELRQRSIQTESEIASQNQELASILEEFAGRHNLLSRTKTFNEVNERFRGILRSSMLTIASIGKHNKLMKFHLESGDFADIANRPVQQLASDVRVWAQTIWNFEVFAVDDSPITVGKILIALLLFILGLRLSRRLALRLIKKISVDRHLDPGITAAIETISFYALIIIWAIISLQFVRIPLTVFTIAGGALAIGVGLGSQTIVKNFFNGLILLFERPIRVGDLIQYEQTIGTVSKIGTRSTVINTPDNLEVIVPNGHLIENVVTNWTLSTRRMRRKINVGVAYGSPVRDVSQILLAQAEKHNLVLKDPAPDVLFSNFGESTLDFVLRFWVNIGGNTEGPRVESDLRHMIYGALTEAGITIAFPQRDVHLNTSGPLEVQVIREQTHAPSPGSLSQPATPVTGKNKSESTPQ